MSPMPPEQGLPVVQGCADDHHTIVLQQAFLLIHLLDSRHFVVAKSLSENLIFVLDLLKKCF